MSAATYATVGGMGDVRGMASATTFARLVLIPHERMTAAQLAWHRSSGGWCLDGCRGWWRVLCFRGGQPFAQWRVPGERQGVKLVKVLEAAMLNGSYPITAGPSAVTLGSLEILTTGGGRLQLPGGRKRAAKAPVGAS